MYSNAAAARVARSRAPRRRSALRRRHQQRPGEDDARRTFTAWTSLSTTCAAPLSSSRRRASPASNATSRRRSTRAKTSSVVPSANCAGAGARRQPGAHEKRGRRGQAGAEHGELEGDRHEGQRGVRRLAAHVERPVEDRPCRTASPAPARSPPTAADERHDRQARAPKAHQLVQSRERDRACRRRGCESRARAAGGRRLAARPRSRRSPRGTA